MTIGRILNELFELRDLISGDVSVPPPKEGEALELLDQAIENLIKLKDSVK